MARVERNIDYFCAKLASHEWNDEVRAREQGAREVFC